MKKKYYLLLALSLLAIITINGQDKLLVDPAKIDSLHQLIDSHSKADKEKVRLLNEYARLCFYNQEYKEGLIATRDARELSEKIKYESGLVMYHITLSVFARVDGGGIFGPEGLAQYHAMEASMLASQADDNTFMQIPALPNGYPYPFTEEILKKLQTSLDYFTELGDKEIEATIIYYNAGYYNQHNQPDKRDQMLGQFIALYKSLNKIDPVILVYRNKLQAVYNSKNQKEVDSLVNELTNLINQTKNITGSTNFQLGLTYLNIQQYASAIGYLTKSADLFEKTGNIDGQALAYTVMNRLYMQTGMHSYRVNIFERFIPVIKKSTIGALVNWYANAVWANYNVKNYDKAREYMNYILDSISLTDNASSYMKTQKVQLEGQILMDEGKYTEAIPLLFETYKFYDSIGNKPNMVWSATHLANCYYQLKDYESALQYATIGYKAAGPGDLRFHLKANLQLADIYEALGKKDSAYIYLRRYQGLLVESNILQSTNQILGIQVNSVLDKSNEQISLLEQESLLKEQRNRNQQLWIFSVTGALLSTILILFILYRNNKSKQKANTVLEHTLSNLKATQSQLIQSEKMASLGELTAGVAHEIQNPLNFVNNFSEVSTELIKEIQDERRKTKDTRDETLTDEILNDIEQNLEKINHHGKRADAIVKGMLQHSKGSAGQKEPTDINALCDEYLRLSYHGLRAKDKNFNAKFETDFDPSLPKINVVPQDIGRVVLNLINNAFYAVNVKTQDLVSPHYEATVSVSTKMDGGMIQISVKDNGPGIPGHIKEKIFQPFFTTKPTGQGTGLGLSLSYDIVKAHGGELKVETELEKGSVFILTIPVSTC